MLKRISTIDNRVKQIMQGRPRPSKVHSMMFRYRRERSDML
jgi:hypothetical protein